MTSTARILWIGTYPAAGAGTPAGLGEGIWTVRLDPASGTLSDPGFAAATPAPSFVATHPAGRVLYAVGEQAAGTVTAFAAGPGGELAALAIVSSGGADPCHLLLSPDARTLYVTNYSSGTVAVLPLDSDGGFARETIAAGGPVQILGGSGSAMGPDVDRQEGPHAHFAALAPGGAHLLVVDLGADELRRYRIEAGGLLAADGVAARLPPGTGPRHLAIGRDRDGRGELVYVVGELDGGVRVLRWDRSTATASLVQTVRAAVGPLRSGHHVYPAHVVLDGSLLLVSVRGADVVASFAVDPATGLLEPAGETHSGGSWPRHFARVGGVTVVANQVSGTLTALTPEHASPGAGTPGEFWSGSARETGTRRPKPQGGDEPGADAASHPLSLTSTLALPSPACVVPAR